MFQKRQTLGLILLSIILFSFTWLSAQEEENNIIIVSKLVGEWVDLEERNRYNLFPDIEGFYSAVFIKSSNGEYFSVITAVNTTTGETYTNIADAVSDASNGNTMFLILNLRYIGNKHQKQYFRLASIPFCFQ